jgi:hypothetical protein
MYARGDPREFGELGCGLAGLGLSVCNEAHVYEWCKRVAASAGVGMCLQHGIGVATDHAAALALYGRL